MATALDVANYFVYIMSAAFDDLTNMKINKLLYFAQGHYLKKYGVPLFNETIEAWDHGPVVSSVYTTYKWNGDKPVTAYDETAVSRVLPKEEEVLFGVARKYGKYTDSVLRRTTQVVGSPWSLAYREGQPHTEIPLASIQDYFDDVDDLTEPEIKFKESDFVGYRNKDGLLVLPMDWDDEEI